MTRYWSRSVPPALRSTSCIHLPRSLPTTSDRLADCDYGGHRLSAMVKRDNVTATQFHPERSGTVGLSMLKEFLSQ